MLLSSGQIARTAAPAPGPSTSSIPKLATFFCTVPLVAIIATLPASALPLYEPIAIPAEVSPFSFCASIKFAYIHCAAANGVTVPVVPFATSYAVSAAACRLLLSNISGSVPTSAPSGSLRSPTFKLPNTVVYAGLVASPPDACKLLPPCIDCRVSMPAAPAPTCVNTVLLFRANP